MTSRVARVVAVSPSTSVEVAETVSVKSTSESAGGVTVNPVNWAGVKVHVPSRLSVPAESCAPVGTPETVMSVMLSEPSTSFKATPISRAIAVSSPPVTSATVTVGTSATPVTVTSKLAKVVAESPSASVEVALTVSVKSASESSGGVTVRPTRSAGVNVQVPSRLSVPAESWAPAGTPETVMSVMLSEPSTSFRATPISKAMAESSALVAATTFTVDASAHAGDGDVQIGQGCGGVALGFRRCGGHTEREVGIGIIRRGDGQPRQLGRRQCPSAVQIVGYQLRAGHLMAHQTP